MKRLEKLLCCLLCVALLLGWPAMMEEDALEITAPDAIDMPGDDLSSGELLSDELLSDAAPEVGEILSLDEDEKDSSDEVIVPAQGDDTTVYGDDVPMQRDEISVDGDSASLHNDDIPVDGDSMPSDDEEDIVIRTDDTPVDVDSSNDGDDILVTKDDAPADEEELPIGNGDAPVDDTVEAQEDEISQDAEGENGETAEGETGENDTNDEESGLLAELMGTGGNGIDIDATFEDFTLAGIVRSEFDNNPQDGFLNTAEIAAAKELNVPNKGITSMKGIEVLTELTELYCSDNDIGVLNVSKNTQLTKLSCHGCHLTTLDASKNTKLTYLCCDSNKYLKTLNVSKNTQLTHLCCFSCGLSKLDISNNTNLTVLYCKGNKLENLDITKNTKLTCLDCYGNKLTMLNISLCPRLVEVVAKELDFSDYVGYGYKLSIDKTVRLVLPLEISKSCTKIVGKRGNDPEDDTYRTNGTYQLKLNGKRIKSCKSSNKKVAKVTKSGLVICSTTKTGKTTITITPKKGKKIKLKLIVADPDIPARVTIVDESNQAVKHCKPAYDGEKLTFQLTPKFELSTATSNVLWATDNPRVATVDQQGLVTPQGAGTVTITCYALKGGAKGTRKFTVIDPTMPMGINLLYNGAVKQPKDVVPGYTRALLGQENNQVQLGYAFLPTGNEDSRVAWSSSDVRIARVDQAGLVTPLKPGTVTITVWALRAGKKASVRLKVTDPTVPTRITFVRPKSAICKGDRVPMSYKIDMPGMAIPGKLIWKSSNKKIATVDQSGIVTFKKAGKKVTITVKTSNGGKKASITLKAVKPTAPTSIRLQRETGTGLEDVDNESTITCYLGDYTIELKAILGPDTARGTVRWESSDTSVATVDGNGVVTMATKGETTITASSGKATAWVTLDIQ